VPPNRGASPSRVRRDQRRAGTVGVRERDDGSLPWSAVWRSLAVAAGAGLDRSPRRLRPARAEQKGITMILVAEATTSSAHARAPESLLRRLFEITQLTIQEHDADEVTITIQEKPEASGPSGLV
jgi:hypothetical protein